MKCFLVTLLLIALLTSGCGATAPLLPTPLPATATVVSVTEPAPSPTISVPPVDSPTTVILEPTSTASPTATIAVVQMEIIDGTRQTPGAQPQTCQLPQNWVGYTVRSNDTLSSLAQRTGTSTQQIQNANCLTGTLIFAGQILYLPFIPVPLPGNTPSSPAAPGPTVIPVLTPKTGLPGDHLVTIVPASGPPGTVFELSVDQYASNEEVFISIILAATGAAVVELKMNTDADGNLTWSYVSPADAAPGDYNVFEDGTQSKAAGKGHFSITAP